MKKLLLILLLPALAFAQPPPIQTEPLSVNRSTHAAYPTDAISGILTDAMSALTVKPWSRLVATTNQTLSGTGTPIDSVTLAVGDVVLLTAQTTGSERGPWVVASGAWTRPAWYASGHTTQSFQNIAIKIRVGTQFGGTWWRMSTTGPITIDTTATTWLQTGQVSLASGVTGTLAAVNFPALTGDVTNTAGSLATTITAGAVTLVKMANIGAMTVLGRVATSGTGAVVATTSPVIGSLTIGGGSTSPFPLMAIVPVSGPIAFTAKLSDDSSYAQFAFKNASDAQRGFMGFIGSGFGNANRQNNFEFGTSSGSRIAFRPGDGDGNQFLMDENGNLRFGNTAPGTGAQRVLVFGNSGVPTTSPANTGQLYSENGTLKWRGSAGTVTAIAIP